MLLDDSRHRTDVALDRVNIELLMGVMVWRETHTFSPYYVLLPLSDGRTIQVTAFATITPSGPAAHERFLQQALP